MKKHPEYNKIEELFNTLARHKSISGTFSDLLDYFVICLTTHREGFSIKDLESRIDGYSQEDKQLFRQIQNEVYRLVRKNTNLWASDDQKSATMWIDVFGSLYEQVTSKGKQQGMGQFFSPIELCTLNAGLVVQKPTELAPNETKTMLEPTSGSGRFILAANAINPGIYSCGNDLDSMCAKMTAINMALNGAEGDVTCGDGLDSSGDSFRFGWKIMPTKMALHYAMSQEDRYDESKFGIALRSLEIVIGKKELENMYSLVPMHKEEALIYKRS